MLFKQFIDWICNRNNIIIINCGLYSWNKKTITYKDVLTLSGRTNDQIYIIYYIRGHSSKPRGSFLDSDNEIIKVKSGMYFQINSKVPEIVL